MSDGLGDLLSYRPADFLMFAPRIYWRLFEAQNRALWPLPLLLPVAALAWLLWFLRRGREAAPRAQAVALGLLWLFVAWAFLWQRYAPINWAAEAFAAVFALQGLALLLQAARGWPPPGGTALRRRAGRALLGWALLAHPLLAALDGRPWQQAEAFGLAPDPTAIGTLGWLLLLGGHGTLWVVPLLWCAVSAATLATMGSVQALVPFAAALLALAAALRR